MSALPPWSSVCFWLRVNFFMLTIYLSLVQRTIKCFNPLNLGVFRLLFLVVEVYFLAPVGCECVCFRLREKFFIPARYLSLTQRSYCVYTRMDRLHPLGMGAPCGLPSVCMYVCVCMYVFVCMYVCVYVCICVYVWHTHKQTYTHKHTYTH